MKVCGVVCLLLFIALIDDRGHEPLTDLLSELGGWPVLDDEWAESTFDLETTVAKLRLYGSRPLVNMWVGVDDRQSNVHVIAVSMASNSNDINNNTETNFKLSKNNILIILVIILTHLLPICHRNSWYMA